MNPPRLPAKFPRFWSGTRSLALFLTAIAALGVAASRGEETSAWEQITLLQKELAAEPPPGENSVEYEAPIEARLHDASGVFARDFPASSHRWEAALVELKTVAFPAPAAPRRIIFREQEEKLAAILQNPAAPEKTKADAERTVVRQHLDHLDLIDSPEDALALERRLSTLIEKNPADPKLGALQLRRVDLLARADPARAHDLLETLAGSSDAQISGSAKGRLAQEAFATRPLDWTFTDVRGQPFDVKQYRGKVVLIEFWATWCPDCLRELPQVLQTYNHLHDAGFEVVGVSLDKNQEALTSFIKKRNMPWPQFFDGKGWDNSLAVQYGVRGIPEMWLLDKEGRLVATGLHAGELDQRAASLLHP